MKINKRLKKISEYIPNDSNIIDVGCDHALLDIYLVLNKKNINAVASDINVGPLKQANINIDKYDLSKRIKIKQGNGLETIDDSIDTIVISGLGGTTIVDIILKDIDKLKNINRIVLSPNNDFYKVRKKITKIGYIIENEELLNDKDITYLIISFIKGKKKYSKKQLMFGINQNKNDYYGELERSESLKLERIPKKYVIKRIKIKKNIRKLKKMF